MILEEEGVFFTTVTRQEALLLLPSIVVAVITHVPVELAVNIPFESTDEDK